jgi:MFS family permease
VIQNRVAILVLLTGLNLINYIDRYLVMAVSEKFGAEFGLSDGGRGAVVTAFMFGYMLTSPIFGSLGDRRARKGLIAAGVAIWSLATVASGLTHGFGTMFLARVAVGVGEASYATLSPTIIDDLAPREAKSRWLAIFYAAIPVGAALGYIVGGLLLRYGWRTAFFVAGGPGSARKRSVRTRSTASSWKLRTRSTSCRRLRSPSRNRCQQRAISCISSVPPPRFGSSGFVSSTTPLWPWAALATSGIGSRPSISST